jgi:hypothetical protein
VPSGCSGDYFIRVGLPSEWLWVGIIVLCDASIDGSLQIDDVDEGAAFEASFGQHGEEAIAALCPHLVECELSGKMRAVTYSLVRIYG